MSTPTTPIMRQRLSSILIKALNQSPIGLADLPNKTGLTWLRCHDAVVYGKVEAIDLIYLCRALDLDAAAVLADVANYQPEAELEPKPEAKPNAAEPLPYTPPFRMARYGQLLDANGILVATIRGWQGDRWGSWIAQALTDCAIAERDGDNCQSLKS
jgi:hypothetical protein